jgi:WXG100 family type VII secretion target
MADKTIVDYEQMQDIARKFYAEGDELTRLLLQTRQKVHETQADWIGRGADSFNDDMDNKILPALQRLCEALLYTNQITKAILAVYHQSEDEAAALFKELHGAGPLSAGLGVGQLGAIPGVIPIGRGLGGLGVEAGAAAGQGGVGGIGGPVSTESLAGGVGSSVIGAGGSAGVAGSAGTGGIQGSLDGLGTGQASQYSGGIGGVSAQAGGSAGIQNHGYGVSSASSSVGSGSGSSAGSPTGGTLQSAGTDGGNISSGSNADTGVVAAVGGVGAAAGGLAGMGGVEKLVRGRGKRKNGSKQ